MKNETIINRKEFFKGITQTLIILEQDGFKLKGERDFHYLDNDNDTDNYFIEHTYKTYSIYLENKQLVQHRMLNKELHFQGTKVISEKTDLDLYFNLDEAKKTISPLLESYPYLENIIEKVEVLCTKNNGNISCIDILNSVRDYVNETMKTEQQVKVLNKIITMMAKNQY